MSVESHIFIPCSERRSPDGTITHCLSHFSLLIHKKRVFNHGRTGSTVTDIALHLFAGKHDK